MTVATGPPIMVIAQTECGIATGAGAGGDATTAAGAGETAAGAGETEAGALAASNGGSIGAGTSAGGTDGASAVATIGPTWSRTRLPASQPMDLSRPIRSTGAAIARETIGDAPARSDIRISRGSARRATRRSRRRRSTLATRSPGSRARSRRHGARRRARRRHPERPPPKPTTETPRAPRCWRRRGPNSEHAQAPDVSHTPMSPEDARSFNRARGYGATRT